MKKIYLTLIVVFTSAITCFAQTQVPDSWLMFPSGGGPTWIDEDWGLELSGSPLQPVKVISTSFMVGYTSNNQDFGVGNALISGRVGIGTTAPNSQLHIIGGDDQGGMISAQNTSPDHSGMNMFNEGGQLAASFQFGNSQTGGLSNSFFFGNRMSGPTTIVSGISANPITTFLNNGNVGIGTTDPHNKLDVNGTIHSKIVSVDVNGWPDYVFKTSYHLISLNEVGEYLRKNQHLPEMPSAEQIEKKGLDLGEMNAKLLKKVEELTLYLLDQNEKSKALQLRSLKQQKELNLLRSQVTRLSGHIAR